MISIYPEFRKHKTIIDIPCPYHLTVFINVDIEDYHLWISIHNRPLRKHSWLINFSLPKWKLVFGYHLMFKNFKFNSHGVFPNE